MFEAFTIINERFPLVVAIVMGIFGSIVGSFLNVCIARFPLGRSVVYPGSHCACGKPIAWFDNIPVISWFALRGKCRPCGLPFSFRYPLVEALTGILFAITWWSFAPMVAVVGMLFISLMIVATFVDWDYLIIPDRISVGGAFAGMLLSFAVPALHGYEGSHLADNFLGGFDSLIGLLVGTAIIYWIGLIGTILFRKDAMGEGDMKLLACIGAFLGWQGAVFSLFGGAILGILVFLPLHFVSRKRKLPLTAFWTDWETLYPSDNDNDNNDNQRSNLVMPFGPMLALGAVVYFLWLQGSVDAYFAEFASLVGPRFH